MSSAASRRGSSRLRMALLAAASGALPCAADALEVFGVPSIAKIAEMQSASSEWQPGRMEIECARNEAEAFQIVARSRVPVQQVAVVLEELRGDDGAVLPLHAISVRKVEWVDVNAPFDPAEPSTHPNFLPDPLPPVDAERDRFAIAPAKNLVFWLTVTTPHDARAGVYRGRIRLREPDGSEAAIALELRVRDYALPARPILQSLVGLSASAIYRAHGCTTREDRERVVRGYFDEYIRARLSPFLYAPGTMAFHPLPDAAIRWEFSKDAAGRPAGGVTLDFTSFDREAVRYFDQRHAFSAFNCAPYLWTRRDDGELELRLTDANGAVVRQRTADGSIDPVFEKLIVALFRQIAAHLAEKGWLDRAIYYVADEPRESDVDALEEICRLVRRADPRIRTALTYDPVNRPRLAELAIDGRSLISLWIPKCMLFREDVAAAQRAKGADYWLYDVKERCLISHPGLMNRAMFWDVWRRNASGYLYYLSTLWNRNAAPWTRPNSLVPDYEYRHGDGYFFYPPLGDGEPGQSPIERIVPSIRWELMREGAEDYDCLRMLERLVEAVGERNPAAAAGRRALVKAREFAAQAPGTGSNYTVQMLELGKTAGWSWSAGTESWLTSEGAKPATLKVRLNTELPDGPHRLTLRVFHDPSRRYSHFLVNGAPCASPAAEVKGPVVVEAGEVTVRDGICSFDLSSSPEKGGVIVYGIGLHPPATASAATFHAIRREVAAAIELLQPAVAGAKGGRFTSPPPH